MIKFRKHDTTAPRLWGLGYIEIGPLTLMHGHSRTELRRVGTKVSATVGGVQFLVGWGRA